MRGNYIWIYPKQYFYKNLKLTTCFKTNNSLNAIEYPNPKS